MNYLAYGSNMLEDRLRDRAPSAAFVGVGVLRGYRLTFNKRGRDGSGKCNVERSAYARDLVYGVVFRIDDAGLHHLDRAEDVLRGGYSRCSVEVEVGGSRTLVETYFANPSFIEQSLGPFDWYQAIVVAGALEHQIPSRYVDSIASVPNVRDPDEGRRERALATLGRFRSDFQAGRLWPRCGRERGSRGQHRR